jgi:hypothetical protein
MPTRRRVLAGALAAGAGLVAAGCGRGAERPRDPTDTSEASTASAARRVAGDGLREQRRRERFDAAVRVRLAAGLG